MRRIDTVFAFIAIDENGDEGVPAFLSEAGWMPMVGADLERVESLRPHAQAMADNGVSMRLVHFTTRVEVEELKATPLGSNGASDIE